MGDGAVRHGERSHPRAGVAVRAARPLRRDVRVHGAAARPADRADRGRGHAHAHRHAAARPARDVRPAVLPDDLRRRGARAAPPALRLARARAALPGGPAAPGGVAALGRLLALARAGHAPPGADPVRAPGRGRAAALGRLRPDRDRRAVLLAHLDARGVGPVRAQPRAVRRDRARPGVLRRQRPHRHRRGGRARPAARRLHPAPARRAAARARRPRRGDVPDHRRGRPVGDPALHDDPVAAALALRCGGARWLDARRGPHAAPRRDRDRRRLGAADRLARALLLPRLRQARRPGRVHRGAARRLEGHHRRAAGRPRAPPNPSSRPSSPAARSRCPRTP